MINIVTKICTKCGIEKPLEDFPKQKNGKYGRRADCTRCHNYLRRKRYSEYPESAEAKRESARQWSKRNPENKRKRRLKFYYNNLDKEHDYARSNHLKTQFGITIADYEEMLKKQNGKCVCGRDNGKIRLHVDHDHKTGRVRGLLCYRCNHAIGLLADNPEILKALYKYLLTEQLDWERMKKL